MTEIAFTCGWCRKMQAGNLLYHRFKGWRAKDETESWVRVVALCSNCWRTTELTYEFDVDDADFWGEDDPRGESYWRKRIPDHNYESALAIVADRPAKQYPALTKLPPSGIDDATTKAAWNSAEKAVADPPIKGMAYRQVLESAVKALEAKSEIKSRGGTALAKRIEKLIATNSLPNHLPDLIEKARGLGNRAAHEIDDFDTKDVAIIRELCEAVLRQCFTIPSLVRRTEELIEQRKKDAEEKLTESIEAKSEAKPPDGSKDDIPF